MDALAIKHACEATDILMSSQWDLSSHIEVRLDVEHLGEWVGDGGWLVVLPRHVFDGLFEALEERIVGGTLEGRTDTATAPEDGNNDGRHTATDEDGSHGFPQQVVKAQHPDNFEEEQVEGRLRRRRHCRRYRWVHNRHDVTARGVTSRRDV